MTTIDIDHFDTCFPDYLLDHRDVVGISMGHSSEEDAAEALFDEVSSVIEIPAAVTDEALRAACADAVRGLDLRPFDERGERFDGGDDVPDEQPSAWFKVTIAA